MTPPTSLLDLLDSLPALATQGRGPDRLAERGVRLGADVEGWTDGRTGFTCAAVNGHRPTCLQDGGFGPPCHDRPTNSDSELYDRHRV